MKIECPICRGCGLGPPSSGGKCQQCLGMGALMVPEHLTRREQFAMAAMQGLCANSNPVHTDTVSVANAALACADALIDALDAEDKEEK